MEKVQNMKPHDIVFFLLYAGDNTNEDIVFLERSHSKGFGYYEVYSPSGKSKRRTSLRPSLADDYLAALLQEDDGDRIINGHLGHLSDTIERRVGESFWMSKPTMTISILRTYGWRTTEEIVVSRHYNIIITGLQETAGFEGKDYWEYWRDTLLPKQLERESLKRASSV